MNAFDIETFLDDNKNYIPYCICYNIKEKYFSCYYDEANNLVLYSINNIFQLIKTEIIIYVHNLSFDGLLIISYLSLTNIYQYKTFVRNMSFYKIEIIFEKKKIIFVCSYKIFPLSLKKISMNFTSFKKLPFPYKFSNLNNLFYIGNAPLFEYWNSIEDYDYYINSYGTFMNFKKYSILYCINDVKITHLFMEKIAEIVKEFNINIKSIYSGPSLALKIFIKKFNNNKISFSESGFYDKIVRQAYYGGRCEVYGNPYQNEFIFHYDFSGMYAQCMQEKFGYGKYVIKLNDFDINKPGFYWVEFESNMDRPVLPIHDNHNNKLIFPNGKKLCGCYWFEEIQLFLKKGGIITKILYSLEYEKFDFVFDEYVKYFSSIRKKGEAYSSFGKNMNNFLYGRLGLNEPDEHSFLIEEKEFNNYVNWKKYNIKSIIKINNLYLLSIELTYNVRKDFNLKLNSKFKKNIGIAAAITSKARIKLYYAQDNVLENKGRLLYSDTDSIFASYNKNVLNEQHGSIFWDSSKEDTFIKNAVFISPKTYGLKYYNNKEKIKIKGFNYNEISYNEMENNFYNQKSIIQKVKIVKKKNFILSEEYINKILNFSLYDKRIFIDNYKNTKPIVYASLEN